jgi:hypothetical protein
VKWQVKYALAYISEEALLTAVHVDGDLIRIVAQNQPDVFAVISDAQSISLATAESYLQKHPEMDFLCGYRKTCFWHGEAIAFLERSNLGWGSAGTLTSALLDGNANTASHKTYAFADRLLRQYGRVREVNREYDRIYQVTLQTGTILRIGMIADYEPTADAVRTLWDNFGPVEIVWNVNPNGSPSPEAIQACIELGCEVMKWESLRGRLKTA